jgi:hypothetical protein
MLMIHYVQERRKKLNG